MSWYKFIDKTLMGLHFEPTVSDPCLYSRCVREKLHLILVHVDDILIAGEDEGYISGIEQLAVSHIMTPKEKIKWIHIHTNRLLVPYYMWLCTQSRRYHTQYETREHMYHAS
jgi:hypothetical protein